MREPKSSCCPTCGAPFAPGDDLGDVVKCSHCGNEVIRRVSQEDRIARVAFEKVLREDNISVTAWLGLALVAAHVGYVSFRWALSPSTAGIAAWLAWGCAVYSGAAIVSLIIMFLTRKKWSTEERDRKIFEQCGWSMEKFRVLARDPKSKIGWVQRKSVESEYQIVKKWMS